MMVEEGESTCSWTATGAGGLLASVELSMGICEMTSCEHAPSL